MSDAFSPLPIHAPNSLIRAVGNIARIPSIARFVKVFLTGRPTQANNRLNPPFAMARVREVRLNDSKAQ